MSISKKLHFRNSKLNKVIWFLTLSDIFTWGLYMIINSFVGIYLSNKLGQNVVIYIGIGSAIYYFAKGGFQIPIGMIIDRIKHDQDDIVVLLLGNILLGIPYLFYPLVNGPATYYILQFILGFGCALNLISWRKLFAQNLTDGREGLSYGIYDTIMSFCMIIFSIVAGFVANLGQSYFDIVMITIGLLSLMSGFWVIGIFFVKNRTSN